MNGWALFDLIFMGPTPTVTIDSSFSHDETVRRILALNAPDSPDDPTMLELSIQMDGDTITVDYEQHLSQRQSSVLESYRPVFRGRLTRDDPVQLVGTFGLPWSVRLLGMAAVLLAILMSLGSLVSLVSSAAVGFWIIPLVFVIASMAARVNSADDMRLIVNNLSYALGGDD